MGVYHLLLLGAHETKEEANSHWWSWGEGMKTQMCDHLGPRRQKASSLPSKPFPSATNETASRTVAWLRDAHHAAMGGRGDDRERGGGGKLEWRGRCQDRGLTGACVVLEGTHAVSVGRERAHPLSSVGQPALNSPVRTARVQEPLCELEEEHEGQPLALMARQQPSNHYLQGGKRWQVSMGKSTVTPERTPHHPLEHYAVLAPLSPGEPGPRRQCPQP